MAEYFEKVAREQHLEPPQGYGYKADVPLGVGCWVDQQSTCKVLEKPVCIPSGAPHHQGYLMMYGYGKKEAMVSILEGQMPPMLPCTMKDPKEFGSLEAIADNFGNKDPKAAAKDCEYCVAFRVPADLVTKVETPERDLWLVRFDQDLVSPFLQFCKEGNAAMVAKGVAHFGKGEIVDETGISGLMMAAMGGWQETCQALLDARADASAAEPRQQRTPLMFAAQGGHTGAVSALLAARADAAKADADGNTALMWAAVGGRTAVVQLLAPVSPKDAKDKEGRTARQIAEQMKHSETAAALA